mmetsp:Transcript_51955/g.166351  ORF Transcript_51955/g.166351 Transcript_51955/m.166351 type:complete len:231 (+) Transcript_51955:89-781(+)
MVAAACPPHLQLQSTGYTALTDTLESVERAVGALSPGSKELRAAADWLRAILADALLRLGETPRAPPGAEALQEPGAVLPVVGNSPDALDEWYIDAWASAGGDAGPHRARQHSGSSPCSQRWPRDMVPTFSLEQADDTQTEVEGALDGETGRVGALEEIEDDHKSDPHWQYGRCVAAKLVAYSPPGCSAFEQLLVVLMTVFELPEQQRVRLLAARRKAHSWWSIRGPRAT